MSSNNERHYVLSHSKLHWSSKENREGAALWIGNILEPQRTLGGHDDSRLNFTEGKISNVLLSAGSLNVRLPKGQAEAEVEA